MYASGSIFDPFTLPRTSKTTTMANRNLSGKVLADPRGESGETTVCLIVAGDSMAGGYHQSSYAISNPSKVLQLNIFDGGIYQANDPLLGLASWDAPNNRSWMPECGDLLIAAGVCSRVVWIPVAIGATVIDEWSEVLNQSIVVAKRRAEAQGLTVSGVLMQCGANDISTTEPDYLASAETCIDRANLGVPWLWAKSTYSTGIGSLTPVRSAIDTLITRPDVYAGPDTDDLAESSRWDNVHFNDSGLSTCATRWKDAIEAAIEAAI